MRIHPTQSYQAARSTQNVRGTKPAAYSNTSSSSSAASVPSDPAQLLNIAALEMPANVQAAFQSLLEEVGRLKQELEISRKRVQELEKLADSDPLLPMINRRAFLRELTRFLAFAERYGIAGSLLYFDLNGMKRVNDELGHEAGDGLLLHFSQILLRNIRDSDVLGRLGGDEFGIILAQTDQQTAEEKATDLVAQMNKEPFHWRGQLIPVSCAIGVHQISHIYSADEALAEADKAMYVEKKRRYATG